jgi:hypothetical protein
MSCFFAYDPHLASKSLSLRYVSMGKKDEVDIFVFSREEVGTIQMGLSEKM